MNLLFLTDKADDLFKQILPMAAKVADGILRVLSDDERAALNEMLIKIEQAL
jgi:DNA-binding MarR family transcriptional regulator